MRHTMRILNGSGDQAIATWDPKVKDEVQEAEFQFDRHAASMLAFTDDNPAEQLKTFRPDVDIILAPQFVGG